MAKEDIATFQQNLALKQRFKQLGLDLEAAMEFTPYDLDLENRRLEGLLDFVQRFQKYGSQQAMDLIEGPYNFPPIFPGMSPDSDWYRFELWLQGKPIRMTLLEQLPATFSLEKLEHLSDAALETELDALVETMLNQGFGLSLNEGVPIRLVYNYLVEALQETYELIDEGYYHLDGCSGYCPGCFQRPWCEFGLSQCWGEDEAAGKIHLIEALNPFVSASPGSLEILQRLQAIEDAEFEQFKLGNIEQDSMMKEMDELWKTKLN